MTSSRVVVKAAMRWAGMSANSLPREVFMAGEEFADGRTSGGRGRHQGGAAVGWVRLAGDVPGGHEAVDEASDIARRNPQAAASDCWVLGPAAPRTHSRWVRDVVKPDSRS